MGGFQNLYEVALARMRRASEWVRQNMAPGQDVGFRAFRLNSTNIREWESSPNDLPRSLNDLISHIKPDRHESDIHFELLLKLGIDLAVSIQHKANDGKDVFAIGEGALFACLSKSISRDESEPLALSIAEWRRELAPAGESTCVFRDSAFADDVAKTNLVAILQQHGFEPEKNIRSL